MGIVTVLLGREAFPAACSTDTGRSHQGQIVGTVQSCWSQMSEANDVRSLMSGDQGLCICEHLYHSSTILVEMGIRELWGADHILIFGQCW